MQADPYVSSNAPSLDQIKPGHPLFEFRFVAFSRWGKSAWGMHRPWLLLILYYVSIMVMFAPSYRIFKKRRTYYRYRIKVKTDAFANVRIYMQNLPTSQRTHALQEYLSANFTGFI